MKPWSRWELILAAIIVAAEADRAFILNERDEERRLRSRYATLFIEAARPR
jgi:hypothetical protein